MTLKNVFMSALIAAIVSVVLLSIIRARGFYIHMDTLKGFVLFIVVFIVSLLFLKKRSAK
ncbi:MULTISPECIES: hypothetical protein [Bacillaceae]|uniref:Uncharacterized protein n=1 Tax=Gottfriedia luciferensis TaxID=178774 RepID=A0ABX2ZS01_9BACI|nr:MULTISPECIES: hypothetical protein [Bacillaceae]ODG91239.1 hypothetical protein BED47_06135 [Gottfriedia luciferensis]PGZ91910.1 hypothetical protein COE53_11015 [Bacillus sp. AFS029533]SFD53958.1 hypothetical protein SAMN02799633_04068 [Bacillus sp. UNCCL81]